MHRKRLVSIGLIVASFAMTLTGCSGDEIAQLNSLPSLNAEADENVNYNMSLGEKQSLIYAQVSERQLLDLSMLDDCSDEEIQQVKTYMDTVDSQLIGQTAVDDGVIDVCFTDYLLAEFEKTPYYWQRTKTAIRGVDSASRSIVVDVTYNTIDSTKDVIEDSFIVQGEPDYDKKMQVRNDKWSRVLASIGDPDYDAIYNEFATIYGDPVKIIDSQRNLGLTEQVFETGNQRTYNGVIDNTFDKQGATMTVRYVLVPNYVLGVNLGLTCKHMYVTNYEILNDTTVDMELFKDDGYATITDNVTQLMNSYFKCIDENDMDGLYKLTKDFKTLDKYYADMFDTTYLKHNNFSISLFDIEGTKVSAGIKVSSKVRAKGSNMTMPNYTDRYYVEFELVDDTLQVTNMTLLSRKLEGEPVIDTAEAGSEGFVASIDLSNDDKKDIEKLICDFSSLQLLGDTTSDDFGKVVDLSVSDEKLAKTKEDMESIGGTKKVVWLQTYQQGTSNYASVKCRELFQQEDNSIAEATVNYEFISKGDRWYIYSYNILSSVKLDTTNLSTSNSLCYVTPGKVEQYTSQIVSTESDTDNNEKDEEVSDGVVFEHEVSAPVLKNGSEEEGLVKMTADTITDDDVKNTLDKVYDGEADSRSLTIDKINEFDKAIGAKEDEGMMSLVKRLCSVVYNKNHNRYTENEIEGINTSIDEEMKEFQDNNEDKVKGNGELRSMLNALSTLSSYASSLK